MHGHSFEWIETKFGLWHRYILWMVMGEGLASTAQARCVPGNLKLAGGKCNGSSAVGVRSSIRKFVLSGRQA